MSLNEKTPAENTKDIPKAKNKGMAKEFEHTYLPTKQGGELFKRKLGLGKK